MMTYCIFTIFSVCLTLVHSEGKEDVTDRRFLSSPDALAQLQADVQAMKDCISRRGVAFTAQMSAHKPVLGDKQIIDFDVVTTNIGNAFDQNTSTFTAPMDGVYVFEVVVGTDGHDTTDLEIVKNGAHLKRVFGYSYTHWGTSTASVTTELASGDHVYVRQYTYNHGLVGHELTSFSGYLIHPSCNFA